MIYIDKHEIFAQIEQILRANFKKNVTFEFLLDELKQKFPSDWVITEVR